MVYHIDAPICRECGSIMANPLGQLGNVRCSACGAVHLPSDADVVADGLRLTAPLSDADIARLADLAWGEGDFTLSKERFRSLLDEVRRLRAEHLTACRVFDGSPGPCNCWRAEPNAELARLRELEAATLGYPYAMPGARALDAPASRLRDAIVACRAVRAGKEAL